MKGESAAFAVDDEGEEALVATLRGGIDDAAAGRDAGEGGRLRSWTWKWGCDPFKGGDRAGGFVHRSVARSRRDGDPARPVGDDLGRGIGTGFVEAFWLVRDWSHVVRPSMMFIA